MLGRCWRMESLRHGEKVTLTRNQKCKQCWRKSALSSWRRIARSSHLPCRWPKRAASQELSDLPMAKKENKLMKRNIQKAILFRLFLACIPLQASAGQEAPGPALPAMLPGNGLAQHSLSLLRGMGLHTPAVNHAPYPRRHFWLSCKLSTTE